MNIHHSRAAELVSDEFLSEREQINENMDFDDQGERVDVMRRVVGQVLGEHGHPCVFDPNGAGTFPDCELGFLDGGYLEIRSYMHDNHPDFVLFDFDLYVGELYGSDDPGSMLFADYLVFAYEPRGGGGFRIKSSILYKIWELVDSDGESVLIGEDGHCRPRSGLIFGKNLVGDVLELVDILANTYRHRMIMRDHLDEEQAYDVASDWSRTVKNNLRWS